MWCLCDLDAVCSPSTRSRSRELQLPVQYESFVLDLRMQYLPEVDGIEESTRTFVAVCEHKSLLVATYQILS
jgi:hypothetical protein